MDDDPFPGARARRAIPVIAAALGTIVVLGTVYLHPSSTPSTASVRVVTVPTIGEQFTPAFDFLTPSLGWSVIVAPRTSHAYVYRTDDGARHWREQLVVTVPAPYGPSVEFFDRDHGFFFAGRLYRTVDGGAHWERFSVPDASQLFTFANSSLGWAITDDGLSPRRLYTTRDGGLTWQFLRPWNIPSVYMPALGGGTPFLFRSDGEGWAPANESVPTLYLTRDRGVSWTPVELPVTAPAEPIPSPAAKGFPTGYTTSVRIGPGGMVVALVLDYFGRQSMYTSSDQGHTWTHAKPPPLPAEFGDMSFADARHWWASRYGLLSKTSDAGRSWLPAATAAPDNLGTWSLNPAQVIDARHAWVEVKPANTAPRGATALAMSSDGGVSWTPVNMPEPA